MPAALSTMTAVAKAAKVTRKLFDKYPVSRGMTTFAVLWTSGNLLQQSIDGNREDYDYAEAIRYGMYGSCVNAPLIYNWIKTLTTLIPGNSLRLALAKGYTDQLIFAPFNLTQFFIGMSLLEGKALNDAVEECMDKLIPTWMVSISIWPIFQTINFTCIPEKNRVMFISLGSFLWMVFLSYIHHTDTDQLPETLKYRRRVHYDYDYGALTEALQDALMETTAGDGFYPSQKETESYSMMAHCQGKNLSQTTKPEDLDFVVVTADGQQRRKKSDERTILKNSLSENHEKIATNKQQQEMLNTVSKPEVLNNNNKIYSQEKKATNKPQTVSNKSKTEEIDKSVLEKKSYKRSNLSMEQVLYSCIQDSASCYEDSSTMYMM